MCRLRFGNVGCQEGAAGPLFPGAGQGADPGRGRRDRLPRGGRHAADCVTRTGKKMESDNPCPGARRFVAREKRAHFCKHL